MEGLQISKETKQKNFKARLEGILDREITVENLGFYMSNALDGLVELTDDVVADFKEKHKDETATLDGKALEDVAYKASNLRDIGEILDITQSKIAQLNAADTYIRENVGHIDEVISPPDQNGKTIINGGLEPHEVPKIKPRFRALLYILANNGIDLEGLRTNEGIVTENMMRDMSYISVEIPELNRLVLVCDEEGNATYIFDLEKMKEKNISVVDVRRMTKEEKNELMKMDPGLGIRLIYSASWMRSMERFLWEELVGEGDLNGIEKPGTIENEFPKVSTVELDVWKNFWTDPETGKHWGSISALCKKLGVAYNPLENRFKLAGLQRREILDSINRKIQAYCHEDIFLIADFQEWREALAVNYSGEWKGFYVDVKNRHWGTIRSLAIKLGIDRGVINRVIENNPSIKSKKIRNGLNLFDAYCLEELRANSHIRGLIEIGSVRVEKEGEWRGFWIDPETGKHWGAIKSFVDKLGLNYDFLRSRIAQPGMETRRVANLVGRSDAAYCYEDVMINADIKNAAGDIRVEKEGEWEGFYIDRQGKHWAVSTRLKKKTGIDTKMIDILAARGELSKMERIKSLRMISDLYCYEELMSNAVANRWKGLPKVYEEGEWGGFYTDNNGKHWGNAKKLAERMGISRESLQRHVLEKVVHMDLKDLQGKNGIGYCYEDLITIPYVKDMIGAPDSQKEGEWKGFYIDKEGRHWAAITRIFANLGLSIGSKHVFLREAIKKYPVLNIKDVTGELIQAYCYEDAVKEFKKIVPVVKEGEWKGFWTDPKTGKHWGSIQYLSKKLGLHFVIVSRIVGNANLTMKEVLGISGRLSNMYCYEDLEKFCKQK